MSAVVRRWAAGTSVRSRSFNGTLQVAFVCLIGLAGLCGAVQPVSATRTPRMPGPWPVRPKGALVDAVQMNTRCEGCHADIAQEWRDSLHAHAYSNPEFQRALAIEPLPFCRGCHAPEANPAATTDVALQRLGVACVSCHVVDGAVLAVPAENRSPEHALLRSAAFATSAACERCHEFEFPGQVARSMQDLMQSTNSEHARSEYAQVSCADCHMPVGPKGRRSHRFDASRNPNVLKGALRVEATRSSVGQVTLMLIPQGVGHAFPTGDLFRRIRVHAEAVGPEFSSMAEAEVYLTRSFETTRVGSGALHRKLVSDTRLLPSDSVSRVIRLNLGPDVSTYPIDYSVTYERVAHPLETARAGAVVEGSVTLAEGRLQP